MDRELWLVTTEHEGKHSGLIATFVSKASIVPELPRVTLGLAKHHHTCGQVRSSGRFTLHLLWPDQLDLIWRFGLSSSKDTDKFAGLDTRISPLGNPLINSALGWIDCKVETSVDIGDRILFLAEVRDGENHGNSLPLTVNRLYHEAPNDKLEQLHAMHEHDSGLDAEAIRQWRESGA